MASIRTINTEQLASLLRTSLQVAGALGAAGYFGEEAWAQIASGLVALGVTLWGFWARSDDNLVKSAADVPGVEKIVATPEIKATMDTTYKKVTAG